MKNKFTKPALAVGSVIFWIILWHLGAVAVNKRLMLKIPLPAEAFSAFFDNCGNIQFWQTVLISVLHILTGFLFAVIIGIAGGILSHRFFIFKSLSAPLLHLTRTVPVAAFIILAWLWIPSGILPSFISFIMVLPIIWSHTDAGLKATDEKLIEAAMVFGMSKTDIIFRVRLPLMSPQFRAGCITGLGIAWKAGVAAEVISSPTGSLGAMLSSAKSGINYEQVFAVTLAVVLLSLFFENLLKLVWREQKR